MIYEGKPFYSIGQIIGIALMALLCGIVALAEDCMPDTAPAPAVKEVR